MLSGKGVHPDFQDKTNLERKLDDIIQNLKGVEVEKICQRLGIPYSEGPEKYRSIELSFFNQILRITYPEFDMFELSTGKALGLFQKVIVMHYLSQSDGFPLSGVWISFSELPSGNFYTRAYEGYTGKQLLAYFGDRSEDFAQACVVLGGHQDLLGKTSFYFDVLPNVRLLAACWLGDEDFLSSYKILFDRSIIHHMTTDGCAILGSILTQKIISTARSLK